MAIFGTIIYNGKSSEDFDLISCSTETVSDMPMISGREIIKGETTLNRPVANHYGTKYNDVLTFEISFVKRNQTLFEREEIRQINAWLTSPKFPALLSLGEAGESVEHFGVFTAATNSYSTGIAILTYEFTSNAPYGWSKPQIYSFSCKDDIDFILDNGSDDLEDYVYPEIVVSGNIGTKIRIVNRTDVNEFVFTLPCEELFINTKHHQIYQKYGSKKVMVPLSDLGWDANILSGIADGTQSIYWLRLVSGKNKMVISGACEISFSYRVPIKVVY